MASLVSKGVFMIFYFIGIFCIISDVIWITLLVCIIKTNQHVFIVWIVEVYEIDKKNTIETCYVYRVFSPGRKLKTTSLIVVRRYKLFIWITTTNKLMSLKLMNLYSRPPAAWRWKVKTRKRDKLIYLHRYFRDGAR